MPVIVYVSAAIATAGIAVGAVFGFQVGVAVFLVASFGCVAAGIAWLAILTRGIWP